MLHVNTRHKITSCPIRAISKVERLQSCVILTWERKKGTLGWGLLLLKAIPWLAELNKLPQCMG